jgi:hypothetical protein
MESGARLATGIQERDTEHYHDELCSDSVDRGCTGRCLYSVGSVHLCRMTVVMLCC